jgi:hypothetical protein
MKRLGEQPVSLYENLLRDANEEDLLPRQFCSNASPVRRRY